MVSKRRLLLPIGSLHILEVIQRPRPIVPSLALTEKQPIRNLLIWPSLSNQQLSYNRWNSHVLARRKIPIVCSQGKSQGLAWLQVSWGLSSFLSVIAFSVGLLWLRLFEEAFIKVVKLSVSILEAESVHLCRLQLCFLVDSWHKQISMTCYAILFYRIHDNARC